MELKQMSVEQLEDLARRARQLAADLQKLSPSYALALEAGVEDTSYQTVRYGDVVSFRGEAIVTMTNGSRWLCKGHGPRGTAEYVSAQGYIEFIPLPEL